MHVAATSVCVVSAISSCVPLLATVEAYFSGYLVLDAGLLFGRRGLVYI